MKLKYVSGVASAAVLALSAMTTASAAIVVTTSCLLADVAIEGENSLGCAGAFSGNDAITDVVDGFGNISVRDGNTVTALVAGDWATGSGPDPVQPWSFGAKYNVDGAFETGVLGLGSITSAEDGTFSVNVSPYAEFVIAFKQASDVAFYYFTNDGSGTYDLNWNPSSSDGTVFSHLAVYVRGERQEVPEPATLALLGLGLVGFGLSRRRRLA